MDILTRAEFDRLLTTQASSCVSIYLPVFRGTDGQQGPVRLKNLLAQAEESLIARGQSAREARDLVRHPRKLIASDPFWKDQSEGLALFISPGELRRFRLPMAFDELAVSGERFHLKPLLPLLFPNGRFFILAASEKRVRLLHGTRWSISEVDVAGLPKNMAEALNYDLTGPMRQFHTAMAGGARGGQHGDYHGDGSFLDKAKKDLLLYFREVDRSLHALLHADRAPLVFAGVDYLFPIYREANSYPHLAARHISGNPDQASEHQLHDAAWDCVRDGFDKARQTAFEQYERLAGTHQASDHVPTVVAAALAGQVETLFVDARRHQWGRWEPARNEVHLDHERQPRSDDLLDLVASQTLLHRGHVFASVGDDMPNGAPLAAVFRYSLAPAAM